MDLAVGRKAAEPTGIRKWVPLGVLGLAIVIIVLDTTLLNVSLATNVRGSCAKPRQSSTTHQRRS